MIRRYLALLLVGTMFATCSTAFAAEGDFVAATPQQPHVLLAGLSNNSSLPPSFAVNRGLPTLAAFDFLPQAGRPQPSQLASSHTGERHWTKGGKIMTIIGGLLAVSGGIMMTKQDQVLSLGCNVNSCTEASINWKATGGLTMGGGAALLIVGLTRHSN